MNLKSEIKGLGPWNKNVHGGLIFATIVIFVYCYFGSFSFFDAHFDCENSGFFRIIYHNVSAFVLFFVFGLIFVKCILKQKLFDVGLQRGNVKLGLILAGIATIIVPLLGLSTVLDSEMSHTYPLVDLHTYSEWYFVLGYFLSYILYYIGWEFLFRGILLLNLEKGGLSPLTAILISTMISALIHTSIAGFGKPMIETLSAIGAGAIFGFISWRTKSLYYSLYMHILIGFTTDIFIFLLV